MIDTILLKYIGEGLSIGVAFLVVYFLIPDNFFKGKIISLIIGTIFSTVFIFYAGRFSEIEKNEKILLQKEKEILELRSRSNEKTIEVITKYVDKIKVIEKEKIVYETRTNEILNDQIVISYPVPNGFVRLHNSAAEGTIPEPARSFDEDPSTFKINQVADTVIDNYLTCRENTEQLISLQEWIKEQQKLFNK